MYLNRLVFEDKRIKLDGFNNLTKSLSFNLYDFCVARNENERETYVNYIQQRFNAESITQILKGICKIIHANILAISSQDYEPWGASSLVLMSDVRTESSTSFHLDKSHICAHTYPDFRRKGTICSFRIDIEISTCGDITPLKALNYMLKAFESDVVVIDYKVRGYTRDSEDRRIYMDHDISGIRDYISPCITKDYYCLDLTLQADNIWQTKMLRTNINENSYFLNPEHVSKEEKNKYLEAVKQEMKGLLHMWSD